MAQSKLIRRIATTLRTLYRKVTLKKELAAPSLTGIRQVWRTDTITDGLTPERLARVLRAANQNDAQDYLTLAEEMEERDLHYASVLRTRKLAIAGLEPSVEAASDEPHDQERADAIRDLIRRPEFERCIPDLLDALGKAYSVVEINWRTEGPRWEPDFVWRDPRFFMFDREDGHTLRLLDEADNFNGLELPPAKFICHIPRLKSGLPIRGGLARLATVAYMAKAYAVKDWLAFAEIYGLPLRVGKYGPHATEDQIQTLVNAVANIGSDAACAIPDSMLIEFQSAASGQGGDRLFEGLANWWDRQVSKGVLGQTMTTDDGASLSQARVHNDVRLDLLEADAKQLATTLNRDLVRPYIDLNFGVPERYPRILFPIPVQKDPSLLINALPSLVALGLEVEQSVIRDELGLPDPAEDARLLTAPVSTAPPALNQLALNARLAHVEDELDQMTAAQLSDWQPQLDPLLDPLRQLAQGAQNEQEFIAGLPGLLEDMDANEFVRRLALATFQARGLGDARD